MQVYLYTTDFINDNDEKPFYSHHINIPPPL